MSDVKVRRVPQKLHKTSAHKNRKKMTQRGYTKHKTRYTKAINSMVSVYRVFS